MKKFAFSTIVAALLGAAAFSMADAQDRGARGPGGPGFGPGGRGGPIPFARLADLTEAQRAQIRSIFEQERENRDGAGPAATLHRQLQTEILADTPDDSKIDALRQQLAEAQADGLAHQIEVQKKIAQVLTPEQRAKAREDLAQRAERRAQRGAAKQ